MRWCATAARWQTRVVATRHSSVVDFYDGLAADYHPVYRDRWDEEVELQGRALDASSAMPPRRVDHPRLLVRHRDAAIGLALRGYRVAGTDIGERSVERARAEAARAGAGVAFSVADFRDLTAVESEFDVVISCDNAIPRLLDDADIATALRAMHAKVRPHGLLVITVRDYDALLAERTPLAPPVLIDGPPRRVFLRMHDWDAPDSPLYTVRFFVLTETESGWTLSHHSAIPGDHQGVARSSRRGHRVRGRHLDSGRGRRLPSARDDG